jgi:hypothetical protein
MKPNCGGSVLRGSLGNAIGAEVEARQTARCEVKAAVEVSKPVNVEVFTPD